MLFRQLWLMIAVLLLLIGIGVREPAIAGAGATVLLAGLLSQLWSRLSLERVEFTRRFPEKRAFVGEEVIAHYTIANRKALPLPWIEVRDNAPEPMPVLDTHSSPSGAVGSVYVTRNTALSWYERVRWNHRYLAKERGFFGFGPARLRSGDIFGLFPSQRELPVRDRIAVLPRVIELPDLGLPSERPFGEARSGSRIFEDPSRISGVRDYRPGDPLKRIDWKATARRQELQSRVYEPSSSLHLLVALSTNTLANTWEGYDPQRLERAVTVAASVARWASERRFSVGLVASSAFPGADRPLSIPPARDPDHLTRILEALAMVSPYVLAPLTEVLGEAARRLPAGATIVAVAGYMSEELATRLVRLREQGHPVALLWVDNHPLTLDLGRVTVYDVGAHLRAAEREWAQEDAALRARRPSLTSSATAVPTQPAVPSTPPPSGPDRTTPAPASAPLRDDADPVRRWARPE